MSETLIKLLNSIDANIKRIADSHEYQDIYSIERDVKDRDSLQSIDSKFARLIKVKGDIATGKSKKPEDFNWDTSIYNRECQDFLIKGVVYHNCTDECPKDCDKNRHVLPDIFARKRGIMIHKDYKNK